MDIEFKGSQKQNLGHGKIRSQEFNISLVYNCQCLKYWDHDLLPVGVYIGRKLDHEWSTGYLTLGLGYWMQETQAETHLLHETSSLGL